MSDGFDGISTDIATVTIRNVNDLPSFSSVSPKAGMVWLRNHPNGITRLTQDEPTNGLGDGDRADRLPFLVRCEPFPEISAMGFRQGALAEPVL